MTLDPTLRDQLLSLGLSASDSLCYNASVAQLYELALMRGEGHISAEGSLVVTTGSHTGRSPKDKFIVQDATTEDTVAWQYNQPLSRAHFQQLKEDMLQQARSSKQVFVQDLQAGADPSHGLSVRVICEFAWHALFIKHLLRPLAAGQNFVPGLTIIDLPSFKADPARHGVNSSTVIALDLSNRLVLIGGTQYAGEIKKSVFSVMNYLLPDQDVLPMHCSANVGEKGDTALFFGLSGTGKTTLSADPTRVLLGDDEHGWSPQGTFNIEGGCYAKVIRLSAAAEPDIFAASQRWAAVLENTVMLPDQRRIDFDDDKLTENTRAAYPLSYIRNASPTGQADHPQNVIMLTADAFGILPPVAKLTPEQAMYHFLSGYTAKVAGTERGVTGPQATFSACFGAPFLPRDPVVYGNMLRNLLAKHQASCWLVNTGWTGGAYGVGNRMPIKATRRILSAIFSGELGQASCHLDPYFGFAVPDHIEGVETAILSPRSTWADGAAYDAAAIRLVEMFNNNFERFAPHVEAAVKNARPQHAMAAK